LPITAYKHLHIIKKTTNANANEHADT